VITEAYRVERFRKALLQFIGGRVAQATARAVLVLILVRILPVADFGAYMLIVGTAEMLLQVASLGLLPLAQRYLPELISTVAIRKLYGFVAFLVIAQIVVLAVVAFLIGQFWSSLAPAFGMSAEQVAITSWGGWLFLVIPAFRFSADLLEAMLEQGQTLRALMVIGRVAAVGSLVIFKPKVTLADVLMVDMVVTAVCTVMEWLYIRRSLTALHTPGASGTLPVREMVRFARHMAIVGPLGATASPGAVRLVLANALGLAESGLYAFLQSLERAVSRYLPATILGGLIRPILISRTIGQGSTELLEAGTGLLLKSNLLIVFAGLVVIAVCGDEIVMILSGGKFSGAGLTLLLLYVNMIATSQRGVQEMVMQITGHTRALSITSVISLLALFAVWLFAKHGLNVAVLIVAAGSLTANWIRAGVLRFSTDWFRVDLRGMAAIFLPGLVAAMLGLALARWIGPLGAGILALALFILLVRIGRPFKAKEIRLVERVIGERATRLVRGFAV
jgi:O-antigen/teichoic acid export membrane protein